MRNFVLRIILPIVIIITIAYIADVCVSKQLQKNTTDLRFTTWNEILYTDISANLVIMGSSRAYVQYDPHILDSILHINAYNLGFFARSFNGQYQRYKVYRHFQKKPSVIIQNIDFNSTLGFYWGAPDNIRYNREQYFPYVDNEEFMLLITDPISDLERNIPFYRYCGYNVMGMLHSSKEWTQYKGYSGQDCTFTRISFPKDSFEFICDENIKQQFIEYVLQAKEEKISMIFVYAPLYNEAIKYVKDLDRCYATFDSIATLFDIPVLDYTFSFLSYDTTYFYNANHLNLRGSQIFSTMLANDLDSLGIIH